MTDDSQTLFETILVDGCIRDRVGFKRAVDRLRMEGIVCNFFMNNLVEVFEEVIYKKEV